MLTAVGLLPLMVVGQFTGLGTISTTVGGQQSYSIPNDPTTHTPDCSSSFTGSWTANLTGTPCSTMALWLTPSADCAATPGATDFQFAAVPQAQFFGTPNPHSGVVTFTINDMLSAGGDAGVASCGAIGVQQTFLLCAAISMDTFATCQTKQTVQTTAAVTTTSATSQAAQITYDTKAPGAPSLSAVDPLDSSLAITFSVSSDTDTAHDFVFVQYKSPTDADFVNSGTAISANETTATVSGLTNGVEYQVRLYAEDAANNVSAFSNVLSATPVASSGFYGNYRSAGGVAQGCSAAPGAIAALLGALWLARRRRS